MTSSLTSTSSGQRMSLNAPPKIELYLSNFRGALYSPHLQTSGKTNIIE